MLNKKLKKEIIKLIKKIYKNKIIKNYENYIIEDFFKKNTETEDIIKWIKEILLHYKNNYGYPEFGKNWIPKKLHKQIDQIERILSILNKKGKK